MKKFINFLMVMIMILSLTACGIGGRDNPSTVSISNGKAEETETQVKDTSETASSESSEGKKEDIKEEEKTEATDYKALYAPVLSKIYDVINEKPEYFEAEFGQEWLFEALMYLPTYELLNSYGYLIMDISGDRIPELIIGSTESNEIFAVYSLQNGTPVALLEGYARNMYWYLGGGSFLSEGSAGAAYYIMSKSTLEADASALKIDDYYFTYEKENPEDIGYFHNNTGEWDKNVSEEISEEEMYAAITDLDSLRVEHLDITPFFLHSLKVSYASDLMDYEKVTECVLEDSEYATHALFYSDEDIFDFKVLSLEYEGVNDRDDFIFKVTELKDMGNVSPKEAILITMDVGEMIPVYGVEYTDKYGCVRRLYPYISGEDGSLMLSGF